MNIRPVSPQDRPWLAETIGTAFGSVRLVSNEHLIEDASLLDGYVAEVDGRAVGCVLVNEVDGDTELRRARVDVPRRRRGHRVALEAVVERGRQDGWSGSGS